ncbi:MAG: hypothetical protein V1866_05000 [archaeon]
MNKLSKIINELDEDELELIRKDLEAGHIERLINQRITEKKEQDFNKVCPVCQTPIDEESLTLIFGPKGLKRKASFCALDCLQYFVNKIKTERAQGEERLAGRPIIRREREP